MAKKVVDAIKPLFVFANSDLKLSMLLLGQKVVFSEEGESGITRFFQMSVYILSPGTQRVSSHGEHQQTASI